MKTKKLSVNTICVRGGYTPKNGEPIESESWHEESV